ncbi:MAG: Zn-ribbon domain-containing OB-fold protein [Acidimicrobiia bacterium]
MATVALADRGTLFTFTTQDYLPKAPYGGPETEDDFRGFAVGYVELPGEVIVETRLTGCSVGDLRIGMPVRLVVVPFKHDADGTEVVTYAFEPVRAEGGAE